MAIPKMRTPERGDNVRTNIEAERGRLCMSKTEMCNRLGVTLKTYNGYISGAPIPSSKLEALHSLTGCSVDYLLGLTTQKTP